MAKIDGMPGKVLKLEEHRLKFPRRNLLHLAATGAVLSAASRIAWALDYPTRPVRLIVGFFAGGLTDILARLLSPWLSERFAEQFIVEDQPRDPFCKD